MEAMPQPADQENPVSEPGRPNPTSRFDRRHTLRAAPTRRGLVLAALGGLLVAGVVIAMPFDGDRPAVSGTPETETTPHVGAKNGGKNNEAFNRAVSGDCLSWPDNSLDAASIVECTDKHKFEVAESVDLQTFPGKEYGPGAAPPPAARIEGITQEQCEPTVRRYLGPRFDPNGRFVTSMLWSEPAWRQQNDRRVLCGLQLPGPDGQQIGFRGKVIDLDQSEVWSPGTCLGIDPTTNQPTDIAIDCAAPHSMEVTGTVNLGERFPDALPPEPDQDTFIKDTCTRLTDEYLTPVQLRDTTLTLTYNTVSLPSWSAGSREVACRIGATLGNGGWATLLNSAKGPLMINGQPPNPPPPIPEERLNLQPGG